MVCPSGHPNSPAPQAQTAGPRRKRRNIKPQGLLRGEIPTSAFSLIIRVDIRVRKFLGWQNQSKLGHEIPLDLG